MLSNVCTPVLRCTPPLAFSSTPSTCVHLVQVQINLQKIGKKDLILMWNPGKQPIIIQSACTGDPVLCPLNTSIKP
jgi:hypothetical protein